jgi:hypothetical protein
MQFLNPIWLWGLTGILIPIGIHLLSRKEGRIVKIGSVRHLENTHTKQFKSLRLNEILLLVLRCLLITTLVFLLSGLHIKGTKKKGLRWVLIENGLEHEPEFSSLIDSLQRNEFDLKIFAPGFPNLKDSIQKAEPINYWSLMKDLEEEVLDQVIVLSYSYAVGFKGLRRPLPTNVKWIYKNPKPVDFPLQAIRMSRDSVSLRVGKSGKDETSFSTRYVFANSNQRYFKATPTDSIPIDNPDTISIGVLNDPKFQYDKKILLTALSVLKESSAHVFVIDTPDVESSKTQKYDWVIWLSERPIALFNSNTIFYQNSKSLDEGTLFQQQEGINRNYSSWALTKRLNEEVALYGNLTVQLALVLLPKVKEEVRALVFDKRTLPEKLMWDARTPSISEFQTSSKGASSEKIIAIIFFMILIIERFLAFKRNQ